MSKREKGLLDMDKSVVSVGVRGSKKGPNGNGNNYNKNLKNNLKT